MDMLELALKYAILPLLTLICTGGFAMYKKQDARIDGLEKRTSDIEKAVIEIKTDFKYLTRDIKEIKDILLRGNV